MATLGQDQVRPRLCSHALTEQERESEREKGMCVCVCESERERERGLMRGCAGAD